MHGEEKRQALGTGSCVGCPLLGLTSLVIYKVDCVDDKDPGTFSSLPLPESVSILDLPSQPLSP